MSKAVDKLEIPNLLVGAEDAARALGIGRTSFLLADKTGEIGPQSVRIGGRRLWVLAELRAWTLAGCPARQRWVELWRGRAEGFGKSDLENMSAAQETSGTCDSVQKTGLRRGLRINCGNLSLTEPEEEGTIKTL
jgi:hypothetical protein